MNYRDVARRTWATALAAAALLMTALPSQAVPAWARQTGKACSSCHFQHASALNEFGQDFKAGGYVDIKNKPLAGKDLSLADSFYASAFTKLRFQKSNGTDGADSAGVPVRSTHSGEWQLPDEFALLFGGRIGKNMGFMIEVQLPDGEASALAGFKFPTLFDFGDRRLGVVPFSTDALGASYGFELLSTGAVRNIRVSEHRNETSAQQYVFFQGEAGAATGFAFVFYDPLFHVVLTPFTPNHLPGAGSNLGSMSGLYLRAVATPKLVAGWSTAVGLQNWSGSGSRIGDGSESVATKGWAIDAQAQGAMAGMPLGLYFSHAKAPGSSATGHANLFNARANARTATVLTAELGVLPQKATVILGYRRADNGAASNSSDNAFTLGATYQIYQNAQLQLAHSVRQKGAGGVGRYGPNDPAGGTVGGSALTTLMFSAGY